MPAIFTNMMKDELYHRMIDAGWKIIRERGIRKLRVEDVTRSIGIAKGTFYSFFPSKEAFVMAIMDGYRQEAMDALEEARSSRGTLGRSDLRQWLLAMWHSEHNLYRYLDAKEYEWLTSHLPSVGNINAALDQQVMQTILGQLDGVRPEADWRIVANLLKVCALTLLYRNIMHPDTVDTTINTLIEAMLVEIFGQ